MHLCMCVYSVHRDNKVNLSEAITWGNIPRPAPVLTAHVLCFTLCLTGLCPAALVICTEPKLTRNPLPASFVRCCVILEPLRWVIPADGDPRYGWKIGKCILDLASFSIRDDLPFNYVVTDPALPYGHNAHSPGWPGLWISSRDVL